MIRPILATAFAAAIALSASFFAVSPVSAAATSLPKQAIVQSDASPILVQAPRKRLDRRYDRRRGYRQRYVPGRRYGRPPANWRRYGARPGNWRSRGCITVGPVWFCP